MASKYWLNLDDTQHRYKLNDILYAKNNQYLHYVPLVEKNVTMNDVIEN